MALAFPADMMNVDPQTLLLLSQQLASMANQGLQAGKGGSGGSQLTGTGLQPGPYSGAFDREKGKFGFIRQDSGEEDMFVLPGACKAFGEVFPPKGTRVTYDCVPDPMSGKAKAENVQPEGGQQAIAPVPCTHSGIFDRERGNYGFIKQDNGEDDMFVLPGACKAFGEMFPPKGTRVKYNVVSDPRTGKVKGEDLQLEGGALGGMSATAMALVQSALGGVSKASYQSSYQKAAAPVRQNPGHPGQYFTGTFDRERTSFGFIRQDNGQEDMFVLPGCCEAFGGVFPQLSTRVKYTVNYDTKNGKPIAENVQPAGGSQGKGDKPAIQASSHKSAYEAAFEAAYAGDDEFLSGTFDREKGSFGFIKQDNSQDDMFVLPGCCEAFGGVFPAIGTRLTYTVNWETKNGKPIAENVAPESGESNYSAVSRGKGASSRSMPYA